MSDEDGFLQRWARRKSDPQARREEDAASINSSGPKPKCDPAGDALGDDFTGFDFDMLDFSSDYRRFMNSAVPNQVRNKALQRLWRSTDLIAQPDELDDYLEDFREEAMGLPAEMVRSAYRVGRGFLDEVDANGSDTTPPQDDEAATSTGLKPDNPGSEGFEANAVSCAQRESLGPEHRENTRALKRK
jgi:Protein of unknown function (DUF3306)